MLAFPNITDEKAPSDPVCTSDASLLSNNTGHSLMDRFSDFIRNFGGGDTSRLSELESGFRFWRCPDAHFFPTVFVQ